MLTRFALVFACLLLTACSKSSLLTGSFGSRCTEVMEKDGTMFRICETETSVTVEQLGPATPEQLRERYKLRVAARENGLSVLIQNAAR